MNKIRYLVVVFSLFIGKNAFAQAPAWGGGADQNDISYGFTFQNVNSYLKIDKKPDWRQPYFDPGVNKFITSPLNDISSKNSPGFAVSFLFRYRITDHLEVRTTPGFVFADRDLNYTFTDATLNIDKPIQTTMIELPLSVKLKSDRIQDFRAYILGGIKYSDAIGSKKNTPGTDPLDQLVRNVNGFGSYELGLGCDIYFEYFKLSPEVKISNSFGNLLIPENNPYSSPINKLSLHTVTFSLIFE
jgi:Outer membrane protein beta-barrel domain